MRTGLRVVREAVEAPFGRLEKKRTKAARRLPGRSLRKTGRVKTFLDERELKTCCSVLLKCGRGWTLVLMVCVSLGSELFAVGRVKRVPVLAEEVGLGVAVGVVLAAALGEFLDAGHRMADGIRGGGVFGGMGDADFRNGL